MPRRERQQTGYGIVAEPAWVLATWSQQAKRAARPLRQRGVRDYALFFAITYFVQGLGDLSWGLANQPVQYLLKEDMGLTAAQVGFFLLLSV